MADLTPDPEITAAILARARAALPELADAPVRGVEVGLRPGRPAPRVEVDEVNRIRVVHNYGHAGNGVMLSWGCAAEATRLALSDPAHRSPSTPRGRVHGMSDPDSALDVESVADGLAAFLDASPTPFHACAGAAGLLEAAGFVRLAETGVARGSGRHYLIRDGSLVAWRNPEGATHDSVPGDRRAHRQPEPADQAATGHRPGRLSTAGRRGLRRGAAEHVDSTATWGCPAG